VSADYTCLLCGAGAARTVRYPAGTNAGAAQLGWREIALCSACGLGVALPRVAQARLDEFYRSGAYWQGIGENPPQVIHEKAQAEVRVTCCLPLLNGSAPLTVLDVGAGHGWIADWLERLLPGRVARYDFAEPDERLAAYIGHKTLTFPSARLRGLEEARPGYDLVFLNHVLEHVADPVDTTSRIARLLSSRGIAYVETPDSDYRFKDDVFPHTLFFTPAAFSRLTARAGVEQLQCVSFGRWPGSAGALERLSSAVLHRAFALSARIGPWQAQRALDRAIWRYDSTGDGIWLRWIFRRA